MGRHGDRVANSIRLSVNLPKPLMEDFNAYCAEKGQTKTVAAERIITDYMEKWKQSKKKKSS